MIWMAQHHLIHRLCKFNQSQIIAAGVWRGDGIDPAGCAARGIGAVPSGIDVGSINPAMVTLFPTTAETMKYFSLSCVIPRTSWT